MLILKRYKCFYIVLKSIKPLSLYSFSENCFGGLHLPKFVVDITRWADKLRFRKTNLEAQFKLVFVKSKLF